MLSSPFVSDQTFDLRTRVPREILRDLSYVQRDNDAPIIIVLENVQVRFFLKSI